MYHQFVGIGACYLDTILDVPRFVQEDEKLRATGLSRRRGGNCANTIEVLQELLRCRQRRHRQVSATNSDEQASRGDASGLISGSPAPTTGVRSPAAEIKIKGRDLRMDLVSVLPQQFSAGSGLIRESLVNDSSSGGGDESQMVSLEKCLYREDHEEPASSYIIRSEENGSRTIVNYNELPEMTVEEFMGVADSFERGEVHGEGMWFHFEGRIPDVTLECMRYLRKALPRSIVSVEVEKPGRQGLQELVPEADVVFYSRGWAQDRGYKDYEECLRDQAKVAPKATLLCCTWGQTGAAAIEPKTGNYSYAYAWAAADVPCTVDTVGAGDTFIAGMLYASMMISPSPSLDQDTTEQEWSLDKKLEFANELAGRKVVQEGFAGLGEAMRHWLS